MRYGRGRKFDGDRIIAWFKPRQSMKVFFFLLLLLLLCNWIDNKKNAI